MNKAITTRTARPAAVLREGAFANFMRHAAMSVDFENESRAPMLFIAFENDHIIPPKVARHNAEKYKVNPVEFKEFPGRPHFPGAPGWEEVADYALTWVVEHAKTPAPVSAS
jgi:non-heme chloroperoxidase